MASLRHLAAGPACHHPHGVAAASASLQLRRLPSCPVPLRSRLFTRVYALSSNDIRVGTNVEVDGAPWKVLEFLHVKPGKGAAFVRTKMRNYVTGNTVEKTFRAGSTTTFEESRLNEADVGDKQKWLKEGMDCNLLYWNGKIIDFELPITVRLTVTDTDPGASDSVQGGTKPATLETGAVVTVPSFVNIGDDILVDSRTGQYMNRA
ncbi:hypothetical protein PAHAL_8G008900 [Panicum hallii]|uniref:Translation elongation factor P/YeiP central domain-containing protein n=1 Tax=Panicum hallii TaxID=206008 RepID=A0A2S3IC28_9POAL|nr:uncharacterized protein LOC112902932 isoform X2 [Panicum hallii]PAN41007.1 hypothetical protein PAHAL_8G008900 [Panicum hallii]